MSALGVQTAPRAARLAGGRAPTTVRDCQLVAYGHTTVKESTMDTMTLEVPVDTVDVPPQVPATGNVINDVHALALLNELLANPISEGNDPDKTLYALLRVTHRLGGLRDALREVDESALVYANASYCSIHARIVALVDGDVGAELCRLTLDGKPAATCTELRLATAQLYAWSCHVVAGLATRRDTERALNASFANMLSTPVADTSVEVQRNTGLYL